MLEPEGDSDRLINLGDGLGIETADRLDKPRNVYGSYLLNVSTGIKR
jgi:hypothetical protein